jgi:transposase
LELRPHHGYTWARTGHPDRLPATYTRPNGVRHFFGFLDVHANKVWGYFRPRKRQQETLAVLKLARKRYPRRIRIHLILDNFSPHQTPIVLRWARQRKNNIRFVWTPTNASWLNHIECRFTDIKNSVFTNTNYKSHKEVYTAIRRYLHYRNKHKKHSEKRH